MTVLRHKFPGNPLALSPVGPDPVKTAHSLAVAKLPGLIHAFMPEDLERASSADPWFAKDGAKGGAYSYSGFAGDAAAVVANEPLLNNRPALLFPSGGGNIRYSTGSVVPSFTRVVVAVRDAAMASGAALGGVASGTAPATQKNIMRWYSTGGSRMLFLDNVGTGDGVNGNNYTAEPAAGRGDVYIWAYDAATRKSYIQISHGSVLEHTHEGEPTNPIPVITSADRYILGGGAPLTSQSWRGPIALDVISEQVLYDGANLQAALDDFRDHLHSYYNIL